MALFEFKPDLLDAAYTRETKSKQPKELIACSRQWHNKIMRLFALEAMSPTADSLKRIDALRQVYMFYLIRHSFTSESLHN